MRGFVGVAEGAGGDEGGKDTARLKTWAACRSAPVLSSESKEKGREMCFIFCLQGDDERGCARVCARARADDRERKGDLQRQDVFRKPPVLLSHTQTHARSCCSIVVSQNLRHTKTRSYESRLPPRDAQTEECHVGHWLIYTSGHERDFEVTVIVPPSAMLSSRSGCPSCR